MEKDILEIKNIKTVSLNDIKHTQYNIVQGNNLIEAMYNLSINELRIFLSIISLIGQKDDALSCYKLTTKELCSLCGISEKNGKRTINNLRESLMKKNFYVTQTIIENGKPKKVNAEYHFFRAILYNDEFWYVRLSDDLIPFVLCLTDNFTTEKLYDVRNYSSLLSARLDMIFTMYYKKETYKMSLENKLKYKLSVTYSLDAFREMLLLDEKYKDFKYLNSRLIKPAIDEINERNFFNVFLEKKINSKHQVDGITFHVTLASNHEFYKKTNELINKKVQEHNLSNKITNILKTIGFDEKDIAYILRKNDLEQIKKQLKLMSENEIEEKEEQIDFLNTHLLTKKNKSKSTVLNMIGDL